MTETVDVQAPERTTFPCSQCGADLRFAPGQVQLTCDHCGHVQDIPQASAEALQGVVQVLDYHQAVSETLPAAQMEETKVVSCTSCGAQVEFEPAVHSAECPFCASPVVTDTGVHRHIKPQAVLPFLKNEKDAREALKRWLKSLWFAPNKLVRLAQEDGRFNPLYVPYWAFNAFTRSTYIGERGTHYYVTESYMATVNGKSEMRTRQVRRVRWTPAAGVVSRRFQDLLVMASNSLPRPYVRALEPWNLGDLQPYSHDYLAGIRAEGYTVGLQEGHGIALERMVEVIREDARRDIGGDEQRVHSVNPTLSEETFRHVLLPLWTAAYLYGGKSYRFVVNGQTGKVRGERPWSKWKIALAILFGAAVVGGLIILDHLGYLN